MIFPLPEPQWMLLRQHHHRIHCFELLFPSMHPGHRKGDLHVPFFFKVTKHASGLILQAPFFDAHVIVCNRSFLLFK